MRMYQLSFLNTSQGLLNWYFKDRRTMLPRTYNFNLQLCNNHKAVWNELKGDARIVHYTTYKPGDSRADDLRYLEDPGTEPIMEPMTWWWDVYEGSDAAREWNGTFAEWTGRIKCFVTLSHCRGIISYKQTIKSASRAFHTLSEL